MGKGGGGTGKESEREADRQTEERGWRGHIDTPHVMVS